LYACDEYFVTGTMGEITPVLNVDGRYIGDSIGKITHIIFTNTWRQLLPKMLSLACNKNNNIQGRGGRKKIIQGVTHKI